MPVQDLTPQLRTRLSRVERAVGVFVSIATLLLIAGFAYYLYNTAARKGWFLTKARYFTFIDTAAGLKVGDPVRMMGFDVGAITRIDAQPPEDRYFNIYVEFEIQDPYYGYMWTEGSVARVASADLLGKRGLEVTKGTNGVPTYVFMQIRDISPAEAEGLPDLGSKVFLEEHNLNATNHITVPLQPLTQDALKSLARNGVSTVRIGDPKNLSKKMTGIWNDKAGKYDLYTKTTSPYWLLAAESPALAGRMEALANQIEVALPNILNLTNQLTQVLSNAAHMTATADALLAGARPAITNLTTITTQLKDPKGSLGEWLIPTNLNAQLIQTLGNADGTLKTATTTLNSANNTLLTVATGLDKTLENVANLTSNLNAQVQANSNLVSGISTTITHTDEMIQGLKHHWFLRSAFKTPKPPKAEKSILPKKKAR
jgi:ABC-type transporter Mla subunit MlaD